MNTFRTITEQSQGDTWIRCSTTVLGNCPVRGRGLLDFIDGIWIFRCERGDTIVRQDRHTECLWQILFENDEVDGAPYGWIWARHAGSQDERSMKI
jgi:hypothetical protein